MPDTIEDYVGEENSVRVIDAFVDVLDLAALGFDGVIPEETGRPSYHPATLLNSDLAVALDGQSPMAQAVLGWPSWLPHSSQPGSGKLTTG